MLLITIIKEIKLNNINNENKNNEKKSTYCMQQLQDINWDKQELSTKRTVKIVNHRPANVVVC